MFYKSLNVIFLFFLLYISFIKGSSDCMNDFSQSQFPPRVIPHYCLSKGYQWYEESCSCYKFHTKAVPWPEAYSICVEEGARLAVANSPQESDLLVKIFNAYNSAIQGTVHTGWAAVGIFWDKWSKNWFTANDGESYEEDGFAYQWENGRPYTEDHYPYAFIRRDGVLANGGGLESYAFICEKNFTTINNRHLGRSNT